MENLVSNNNWLNNYNKLDDYIFRKSLTKKNEKVETKAYRRRMRSCTEPLKYGGGKDCQRNEENEFDARQDSEVQKTECLTPGSKLERKDKVTPWCPEHCVFTKWGEWGACSETCVEPNFDASDSPETIENVEYVVQSTATMPKRQRIKLLLKPATNGGVCLELNNNGLNFNNGTVLEEKEDCTICKEHCSEITLDPRDWPELKYPGKDPKCVGYCPGNFYKRNLTKICIFFLFFPPIVSCRQGPFKVLSTTRERVKEYQQVPF